MTELSTNSLVENIKGFLGAAREAIIYAARDLYALKQQLPEGTRFGAFVEEHLGISESTASKWVGNYVAYVVEGGASIESITGIDQDKLLLAKNLEGTVEERIAKAGSLSRADLRVEHQEDVPHDFAAKEICKVCGAARENHSVRAELIGGIGA